MERIANWNIESDKMLFGCFNMLVKSTSTYEPQSIAFTSLKSLKHLGGYDPLVKATLQGVDNLCWLELVTNYAKRKRPKIRKILWSVEIFELKV